MGWRWAMQKLAGKTYKQVREMSDGDFFGLFNLTVPFGVTDKQMKRIRELIGLNDHYDGDTYEIKGITIDPPELGKLAFLFVMIGRHGAIVPASIRRLYCIGPRGGISTYNGKRWLKGPRYVTTTMGIY